MPKKKDPIITVLRFFELADLALAEQGLTLVKEIIKNRQPAVAKPKPRKKPPAAPPAATTGAPPPPGSRPLPPKKPAIRPEEDRPLPGLVTEVGG